MPQSTSEWLQGYVRLIIDTLSQRLVNRHPPPNHALFTSTNYLSRQTAIVTGANTGLGLETARHLARAGAHVILACRNFDKARAAVSNIRASVAHAQLEILLLDLASFESIRSFAKELGERAVHMLVLNGGVMAAQHTVPEQHFMINHVGHALLTILLMRNLLAADRARVVAVSSLTCVVSNLDLDDVSFEKGKYNWMTAYANSKLAMLLFMRALNKRLAHTNVCVNAVHPGEATSDVARYLGVVWMWLHKNVGGLFLLSPEEGARTSVYVAGAKEADVRNVVFHRVWQVMNVPERLVKHDDVQRLWEVTIQLGELTEEDLEPLRDVQAKR